MEVDLNNKAQTLAAVRSVQRFLKCQGYRRGNKAGSSSCHLPKSNVLARDSYVKVMHLFMGASPKTSVVYLDESFIHQHYKRHNDSLFDPIDDLDVQRKETHKRRRYCFIAGILDSPDMECQVVALDIFPGGKSTAKQPKAYHKIAAELFLSKGAVANFIKNSDTYGTKPIPGRPLKLAARDVRRVLREASEGRSSSSKIQHDLQLDVTARTLRIAETGVTYAIKAAQVIHEEVAVAAHLYVGEAHRNRKGEGSDQAIIFGDVVGRSSGKEVGVVLTEQWCMVWHSDGPGSPTACFHPSRSIKKDEAA
ncbi:hypothetical protein DYB28_002324 [Aphanomyces astaci]|uniref:Uncharacterized protein n=1 Tax=Aphanomyces astaci TaxID=112090 RepID=A0A9X8ECV3_APHAT|nr:hypothetical protein DYB28_002324 [Aphanomyces astaci]